jgi:protein-disulfide reductase (glutathione)
LSAVTSSRLVLLFAGAVLAAPVNAGCGDPPAVVAAQPRPVATAPANGFGDQIAWRGLDEGLREAEAAGRPILLLVHAAWCPRCKELRPSFFDPKLVELSDNFVMINVDQDAEPASLKFAPDGSYIPRVVLLDPHGKLDQELLNPGRTRFKYFYTRHDDLVGTMRRALERHGKKI